MDQNISSATSTGYPVRYFDQQQIAFPTGQQATAGPTDYNQFNNLFANCVAYPSASSYLHQQQQTQSPIPQSQPLSAPNQFYNNSYNQALSDYAATQYYQQQNQQFMATASKQSLPIKKSQNSNAKKKTPYSKPANVKLHYCEICKISCAGDSSYKDHCKGQKHKKKEQLLKNGSVAISIASNQNKTNFFCEVCSVNCSGPEAFSAHLNGKNHIKVCNLQVKLGKTVPSDLVAPIMKQTQLFEIDKTSSTPVFETSTPKDAKEKAKQENSRPKITVIGTPAINFVKGGSLKTLTSDPVESNGTEENREINSSDLSNANANETSDKIVDDGLKQESNEPTNDQSNGEMIDLTNETAQSNSMIANEIPWIGDSSQNEISISNTSMSSEVLASGEPVGLEYIEQFSMANSKAIYFNCALCDCQFSEINAKEQHVRGKRHHKNYKAYRKIRNFSIAPSAPMSSGQKQIAKSLFPQSASLSQQVDQSQEDSVSFEMQNPYQINMDAWFVEDNFTGSTFRSQDNRYLFKKHSEIVPRDEDLKQHYKHISIVEKSLKLISDDLINEPDALNDVLQDPVPVKNGSCENRILQGEIRTGLFGKKLLLRDENQIDLILFCSIKPTEFLLQKLVDRLSAKLALHTASQQTTHPSHEGYSLKANVEEAAIDIQTPMSNGPVIRITLTSLVMSDRNSSSDTDSEQSQHQDKLLDKEKCLAALTSLRRFKWYQAKIAPFHPCPMIVRLLRDMTKRLDVWKPLSCWALELICERVLSNCLNRPTPAEAFRLILRTLSSGLLINENKSDILIADPCEMQPIDSLGYLTDIERLDITESAQTLVQFVAFNKIYKVLDTSLIANADNPNTESTNSVQEINEESNRETVEINENDTDTQKSQEDQKNSTTD